MKKDCSVVILAAGNSSRMGSPKFALTLSDGRMFIENIVKQYVEFGCMEVIVVINNDGKLHLDEHPINADAEITYAINQHPEYERFYSVQTGLSKVLSNHPVFIHNADNPFANHEVLKALYSSRTGADLIKPVFKKTGGHPILISNKIVKDIVSYKNYDIHLNDFLKNYSIKTIKINDEKILINVNTMSDYKNL